MVLPEPYFSEPVPQLRDSWDNTWCYRKPRRYLMDHKTNTEIITTLYINCHKLHDGGSCMEMWYKTCRMTSRID